MQIKNNIWKHETTKGTLFIKKYENHTVFEKVKLIHRKLEAIQFPYVIPLKKSNEPNLFVQVWQKNSLSADFSNEHQRKQALTILNALHDTSNMIDWKNDYRIPRQHLYQKWNARLERFILSEKELLPYLNEGFYDIVLYASRVLKQMRKKRQKVSGKLTLLHGDVVHHNFLICEDHSMKLIDFDLAVVGDSAEEMILWMHRALPTMNYNLKQLFTEHPFLYDLCKQKLFYLLYPNELLREWLYVLQLGDYEKEAFLDYLMPFTEKALSHWPQLVVETEKLQSK
ncbi:phosphotransferase family enzyme [Ureibacillus xyleni]|uniref:Phosphotransferase family enzyme n=1 Tax=Ureibacillus xyleni TaxID=614648 RepID=A0A285S5Y4_9BACL|nr:phosphotransferase [Ureibacillus xyleni]SOC02481.1 phosphotransferase family enzyme [Ureibacillus xyleni]